MPVREGEELVRAFTSGLHNSGLQMLDFHIAKNQLHVVICMNVHCYDFPVVLIG